MKTSLHRITTSDGIELVGLLYEPEVATKKILVHVHGMAGNFYENKFLDAIAGTLTASGVAFFAFNNRGCEILKDLTKFVDGKKTYARIGDAYEKFEDCVLDISAAIDAVSGWGFSKIHLSGHSLGSPKIAYYLAETANTRVHSCIFLSPSNMLGLVRSHPELFKRDITEATALVQQGKGRELITNKVWDEYPLSAETYISLFGDDSNAKVFSFHDSANELPVIGKISQPICAIMGKKDDALTVSIEETMERITKAAKKSSRVETVILGDANHVYDGYEQELANALQSWIQKINN